MEDKEVIEEKKDEKKEEKKEEAVKKKFSILKLMGNIIYYIIFIFVLLIFLGVLTQRLSENRKAIGGFRFFNIVTESMLPKYKVGDVLVSKEVDVKEIKVGDDVVYIGKKGQLKDMIVTHQVIKKEKKDNGYTFVTKGIANEVEDPEINSDQVLGKIVYKVGLFSLLSKASNNMYVFFFAIFIPLVILITIKLIQVKNEK